MREDMDISVENVGEQQSSKVTQLLQKLYERRHFSDKHPLFGGHTNTQRDMIRGAFCVY